MDLDAFVGYLVAREGLAIDTVSVYRRRLRSALQNGLDGPAYASGDEDAAVAYLVKRRRSCGREAFRNDVRMLNAVARWQGLASHFRQPRRPKRRFVALDDQVVEQLRRCPRPASLAAIRDQAMLETSIYTGMRRGELARMRLQDLDVGRRIYVRASKLSYDRWIPVEPPYWSLHGRLAAWMAVRPQDAGEYVWCSTRRPHRPLTAEYVGNIFSAISRRTGLPCNTRILRHTRATRLRAKGWGIDAIAYMIGDEVSTTAIYAELGFPDVEAMLRSMPPAAWSPSRSRRRRPARGP